MPSNKKAPHLTQNEALFILKKKIILKRIILIRIISKKAQMQFAKFGKVLEEGVVTNIYGRFDAVTSCIQRILNVLFLKTQPNTRCTLDMVDAAITNS